MILDKEQQAQLVEATEPLMQFLAANYHPHVTIILTSSTAELVEGVAAHVIPAQD